MRNVGAIEFHAITDTGRVREHNEDALAIDHALGLAILADGMGGYNAGEVASAMAVAVVSAALQRSANPTAAPSLDAGTRQDLLRSAVAKANQAIFADAQEDTDHEGMGTTMLAAWFDDGVVTVAHVGESPLFRCRGGALQKLTRDHTVVQEQLDAGLQTPEEVKQSPFRHLLTRAIGIDAEVEIDVQDHGIAPGDIYLLCSDGLTDMLEEHEILALMPERHHRLQDACTALVSAANARGGADNISVILVRVA